MIAVTRTTGVVAAPATATANSLTSFVIMSAAIKEIPWPISFILVKHDLYQFVFML